MRALPTHTLSALARHTGLRTATVVEAQVSPEPRDAAVLGDALGRIRVRLGQQVLMDCVNGDLEQPVVLGAVYDDRGEGALAATPGGEAGNTDRSAFGRRANHLPSAQANLTGGHAPARH